MPPFFVKERSMVRPIARAAVLLLTVAAAARPMVHPRLSAARSRDTTCLVWVIFTDKPPAGRADHLRLSSSALKRRQGAGFVARSVQDAPVSRAYVDQVVRAGGTLRHTFRWANAASFSLPSSRIGAVASLPPVRHLVPVARYKGRSPGEGASKSREAPPPSDYGNSYHQYDMMNVPLAHEYIVRHRQEAPGAGVLIALFDSGFWLDHPCYSHLAPESIVGDSDFVAHDSDPTFPVPVHGGAVMSVIAGYHPRHLIGSAWDARFVLARTENDTSEHHVEEDNYVAALVWAEALGVHIVSSSLGYRYDYDEPDTSYSYEDMDGRTTIVAKATLGAIERGVVMVSSMGNDGQRGPGSINSPADSPDVIAVGAVNADRQIASFSSLGPTADGRIKPDLFAMGRGVVAIDNSPSGYANASGTSFSAPLVTGVVALIRQCHPGAPAAAVRERLFESCRFTPFQESIDNVYGRGIPDALHACLPDSSVFVVAHDTLGNRVSGIQVQQLPDGEPVLADSGGTALVKLDALPADVRVLVPGGDTTDVVVDSSRSCRRVTFSIRRTLVVRVIGGRGEALAGAAVYVRAQGATAMQYSVTDGQGEATRVYHTDSPLEVAVSAAGHRSSDTVTVACTGLHCTTSVALEPLTEELFVLFPNVIRRSRGDRTVNVEFVHEYNSVSRPFAAWVRTIDGVLVWEDRGVVPANEPLRLRFGCRNFSGRLLGPGTYFFILQCGNERQVRKFLVVG
ncbi:MAG: S8 family serine peptidase [Chitinivibrionales bacterium]|nr:S8 family serine peptidase [Chitinivibrionales bacterium]